MTDQFELLYENTDYLVMASKKGDVGTVLFKPANHEQCFVAGMIKDKLFIVYDLPVIICRSMQDIIKQKLLVKMKSEE